jgi:hypothetical protein
MVGVACIEEMKANPSKCKSKVLGTCAFTWSAIIKKRLHEQILVTAICRS